MCTLSSPDILLSFHSNPRKQLPFILSLAFLCDSVIRHSLQMLQPLQLSCYYYPIFYSSLGYTRHLYVLIWLSSSPTYLDPLVYLLVLLFFHIWLHILILATDLPSIYCIVRFKYSLVYLLALQHLFVQWSSVWSISTSVAFQFY